MKTAKALREESAILLDRFREAGLGQNVLAELTRLQKKQSARRRSTVRRATAALVVLGGLIWGVPYFKDTKTISTPVAERRSLALADGSRAELNAQTVLKADFRYGRRRLRLESGEGFFSVVHDSAHPFYVETSAGVVRVTGTQFNVRVTADHRAEVTLLEGSVEVRPAAGGAASERVVRLAPGDQVNVNENAAPVHALDSVEMERVLAWRQGRIVLDGLPLSEAAARFAAFHGRAIVVDRSLEHIRLGGTYSLEDLPQFIQALKDTNSITVLPQGDGSFRLLARP